MMTHKPIYVHHPGLWRACRAGRDQLSAFTLGDIIPTADSAWREDPVFEHLYSRASAAADIIAVVAPRDEEWDRLPEIIASAGRAEVHQDLLAWDDTSCILSLSIETQRGRD